MPKHQTSPSRLRAVQDFGANPGNLRMKTYTPSGGTPERCGLVVVLHGCTQTAAGYAQTAGWLELADRFGFALICPEQTRENNANLCFNWFEPGDIARGQGEAASIAAMVDFAVAEFAADPERVYVTGLSAGGAMTSVMLATYPELFAGGAVIAGLPYGVASNLQQAFNAMGGAAALTDEALGDRVRAASAYTGPRPPVSVWHGEGDATVRPAAGDAVLRQWRNVHGALPTARQARTPDGRIFQAWFSPEGKLAVERHLIPRMAHGTPVKTAGPDSYGRVAPYILDVGVSSSFEIAMGWGLATLGARRRGGDDAGSSRPSSHEPPGRRRPDLFLRARQRDNPALRVIEEALRKAGLMK